MRLHRPLSSFTETHGYVLNWISVDASRYLSLGAFRGILMNSKWKKQDPKIKLENGNIDNSLAT